MDPSPLAIFHSNVAFMNVQENSSSQMVTLNFDYQKTRFEGRKQVIDSFQIFNHINYERERNALTLKSFKSSIDGYISIMNVESKDRTSSAEKLHVMSSVLDLLNLTLFSDEVDKIIPNLHFWIDRNYYKETKITFRQIKDHLDNNIEEFWNIVKRYICMCRFETAARCLSFHPDYETSHNYLKNFEEILINWPEYDELYYNNPEQWVSQLLIFQNKLKFLQENTPDIDANVVDIVKILNGKVMDVESMPSILPSAFEAFIVATVFSTPTIKLFEFYRDGYKKFSEMKSVFRNKFYLDEIYESIMTKNMSLLFQSLTVKFNHIWFNAHVWDSIYNYSKISGKYSSTSISSAREEMLFEYATTLIYEDFWEVSIRYMIECPSYSSYQIISNLSCVKFKDENEILKMLKRLENFQILDHDRTISRTLITYQLRSNKPCDALISSIKYKDDFYIFHITNIFIDIFICESKVMLKDIFLVVQSMDFNCPNLTFYLNLCEFYSLVPVDYEKAIEKLFSIFDSGLIPPRAYCQMVSVALPSVLDKKKYLNVDQTIKLMEYFNRWENSPGKYLKMLNKPLPLEVKLNCEESEMYIKSSLLNNIIP